MVSVSDRHRIAWMAAFLRPDRRGMGFAAGLPLLVVGLLLAGCREVHQAVSEPDVYVTAKQAYLRDRVAAVSNRTGEVTNGEKLTVLGRQRRFLHVRAPGGAEGWIEEKLTADQGVMDQFEALKQQHAKDQVIANALTRDEVYLHVAPGRETMHFFRLPENDPLSLLERASVAKPLPPGTASPERPPASKLPFHETAVARAHDAEVAAEKGAAPAATPTAGPPQPVMEDWWLVRDSHGATGWIYGRMIDVSAPDAIARYAEGQRIVGAYVLTYVDDPESNIVNNGQTVTHIPEYVAVLAPFQSGLPYDYNQVRVFIWNTKKHRYETAWREHNIAGYLPVKVGMRADPFNKDPHFAMALPTFTTALLPAGVPFPEPNPETGLVKPARLYQDAIRLEGNICRRIAPPNSPPPDLAHPDPEPVKGAKGRRRR